MPLAAGPPWGDCAAACVSPGQGLLVRRGGGSSQPKLPVNLARVDSGAGLFDALWACCQEAGGQHLGQRKRHPGCLCLSSASPQRSEARHLGSWVLGGTRKMCVRKVAVLGCTGSAASAQWNEHSP